MTGRITYKSGSIWAVADVERTDGGIITPVDRRAMPLDMIEVDIDATIESGAGSVLLMSPSAILGAGHAPIRARLHPTHYHWPAFPVFGAGRRR